MRERSSVSLMWEGTGMVMVMFFTVIVSDG
jgi:hypothetical protein